MFKNYLKVAARDAIRHKSYTLISVIGLAVGLANVIAWPLSYLFTDDFLSESAYRAPIGWGTFLLTGAVALLAALVGSSIHALRVARTNPVEALRHE